jgi:flagellar biosynthetic protein FliR
MQWDLFLYQGLTLYVLIFGRVAGFFMAAIPFSGNSIPVQIKLWLAALVAFLVFWGAYQQPLQISGSLPGYALQFGGEVLIGCVMGFLTQIVFAVFQLAGQLIDTQIGFGIVNVINPQSGIQVPLFGNFQYLLALLCFLAINGHHVLLSVLTRSYQLLPIGGGVQFSGAFYTFIFDLGRQMFIDAFKLALPVVGSLFIADLVVGLLARAVPQMNVFIVSMPLKIGLGLGLVMIAFPALVWAFEMEFNSLYQYYNSLLIILRR